MADSSTTPKDAENDPGGHRGWPDTNRGHRARVVRERIEIDRLHEWFLQKHIIERLRSARTS
jgi:hypothetical protein